ncbi:Magnesium or manganese-dependent protein phosphatase OS=Streptomyces antimycoticus OX=68175 GN=SANT12839_050280 PE=4 SV=1 [Streptomyces antimycoticus]
MRGARQLDQAVVVAEIDEEDAAQVPSIVQPAGEPDVGADVSGAELTAGVRPVPMQSFIQSSDREAMRTLMNFRPSLSGAATLTGKRLANPHKVVQCAPRTCWPPSRPAYGAGTVSRALSAMTRRRPDWSGLPAEPVTLPEAAARACFHPADWLEIKAIVDLAVAEGTLAEARLRIVDEKGTVLRTVRTRSRPIARGGSEDGYYLLGTLQEVPDPLPGTSAAGPPVTGDWRRNREAFLLDAGRALAEAMSTAEVLRVAAGLSMPGFSPEGLAVFGVQGERISVIGHHGPRPGADHPFHDIALGTDYPAAEVVRTGRAVYLPTPEEYRGRFPAAWSLGRPRKRRSWAFLPLIVAGRTIGAWMAGFAHPVSFSPDERSVLTTIARMLAQALSRTALQETERELADGLQRSMLPASKPDIPGLTVAARYVPTGGGLQVGGDWYDVIGLPSGRTALVIGDVQGHDVHAAGIMGQLRIAVRAYASEGHHPDAVLSRASRFLAGLSALDGPDGPDGPDGRYGPRFATCLYMEVDPVAGTLDIARAGHPDPAVRLADGTMMIRPTAGGLPLGIDPDTDYPTTRVVLEPGEPLLMCTDGLIETGGHDLETGWDRIRKVFERPATLTDDPGALPSHGLGSDDLEALADSLVQAVHGPPSTTPPARSRTGARTT